MYINNECGMCTRYREYIVTDCCSITISSRSKLSLFSIYSRNWYVVTLRLIILFETVTNYIGYRNKSTRIKDLIVRWDITYFRNFEFNIQIWTICHFYINCSSNIIDIFCIQIISNSFINFAIYRNTDRSHLRNCSSHIWIRNT